MLSECFLLVCKLLFVSGSESEVSANCMNLVPVGGKNWEFRDNSKDELARLSKSVSAETLVRKLRWATVGIQFDWSQVFRAISISLMRVVCWTYLD